mgnify:CR=1 FL=1
MPRQTKQDKLIDAQINTIYCRRCSGIQINMLDISRVFAVGRKALLAGEDAEAAIVAFVETIRQN